MQNFLNFLLGASFALMPLSALGLVPETDGGLDSLTIGLMAMTLGTGLAWVSAIGMPVRYQSSGPSMLAAWRVLLPLVISVLAIRLFFAKRPVDLLMAGSFDILSYTVVVTTIGVLVFAARREAISTTMILRHFFLVYIAINGLGLLLFVVLGPIPLVSDNGATYSPLARNLHHTSIGGLATFSLAAICLLFDIRAGKRPILWLAFCLGIAASYFSGSSKAALSLLLFFTGLATFAAVNRLRGRRLLKVKLRSLAMATYLTLALALAAAAIMGVDVIAGGAASFADADYKGGRTNIYQLAIDAYLQSPILGLGPGPHILLPAGVYDAHSTPLTILLQTGIVGLLGVTILTINWLARLPTNMPVLLYVLAFASYILFGDILRSIPFWFGLFLANDQAIRLAYRIGAADRVPAPASPAPPLAEPSLVRPSALR